MRISSYEKDTIVNAIKTVDPNARIWLFGSRTDDRKKGGDIDIGVLSSNVDVIGEIEIKRSICGKIGEQKIDLVVSKDGTQAFFRFIVTKGVLLYG